jgi:hypothetical protein
MLKLMPGHSVPTGRQNVATGEASRGRAQPVERNVRIRPPRRGVGSWPEGVGLRRGNISVAPAGARDSSLMSTGCAALHPRLQPFAPSGPGATGVARLNAWARLVPMARSEEPSRRPSPWVQGEGEELRVASQRCSAAALLAVFISPSPSGVWVWACGEPARVPGSPLPA